MTDDGYVYECDRCGERITAPGRIFDKSLCPVRVATAAGAWGTFR